MNSGAAWTRLHEIHGRRITLVDRYDLEEQATGRALDRETRAGLAAEVMAAHYPGLELLGSPGGDPVTVVPYDAAWPARFDRWAVDIRRAVSADPIRVEHVGSTSVPGLPAKPVIDIQVCVPSVDEEDAFVPGLAELGVPLRSREPGHRYFRPPAGEPRVVQVHVCEHGSAWERDHVLFRDYLRAHDDVRDAYAELKVAVAQRFHDDRLAYNGGKTGFILDTLDRASAWADCTGWTP